MIYLVIAVVGLILGLLLFYKTPHVPIIEPNKQLPALSVIIPVRNEAKNIGRLLKALTSSPQNYEIIVVDDDSQDETLEIASRFPVKIIKALNKPNDWLGKSWACSQGAKMAAGEQLLFLDADVLINQDEVMKLWRASTIYPTFSVGPYHFTSRFHEQFSFYFNAIGLAANGFMLPFKYPKVGMFGPIIMISKTQYNEIGGHEQVKNSIIEDVAFGQNLLSHHLDFQLFLGTPALSYQMYAFSFSDLYHGWIKNFASGAIKTSLLMLFMTIIWISVGFSVLIHIPLSILSQDWLLLGGWILIYLSYLMQIFNISQKIGKFKWYVPIIYPLWLLFFLYVCVVSLIYKTFNIPVKWKNRPIKPR